jgi:methionyl-tRNA formyltransferase
MRLLFAGTPDVAVPSLEALLAKHDVAAVLTRPDARAGRGRSLVPSPVRVAAEAAGVRVITDRPKSEGFVDTLRELDVECAVVVAYGEILRRPVLDAVPRGWVNVHFSLLPAWRGAAPVQRAILAGDEVTGASTFLLEEGLDSGPVLGTMTETIRPRDTSGELLGRLSTACVPLLLGTLDAIADGRAAPVAQPADGVSVAPKLTPDDGRVRWTHPALATDRRIRACTPAPGAWTTLPDGSRLGLGPVRLRADVTDLSPGELRATKREVLVGTATHAVELTEVSPVGKKQLVAADWARGARLPDGTVLGEVVLDGAVPGAVGGAA